jgi:hypothetical protein
VLVFFIFDILSKKYLQIIAIPMLHVLESTTYTLLLFISSFAFIAD